MQNAIETKKAAPATVRQPTEATLAAVAQWKAAQARRKARREETPAQKRERLQAEAAKCAAIKAAAMPKLPPPPPAKPFATASVATALLTFAQRTRATEVAGTGRRSGRFVPRGERELASKVVAALRAA